jgi:hypothetical protein
VATYSLTTSPTTIDDGTSYLVQIVNTGAATVTLSRGGTLRPGQLIQVYPEGTALTAASTSAVAGQVTTSATAAKPLPNASDPATLRRDRGRAVGDRVGLLRDLDAGHDRDDHRRNR